MRELKVSTSANVMVFLAASSDHVTGLASATLTITASKDGGAFASVTPTVTDRGSGWYNLALTTSHTDTLGDLALHITATSADPADLYCRIIAIDKADPVRGGLTALPNVAAEAAGGLITRGTGTGQLSVTAGLVTLAGVTHTGAVIPTVTTLTGHTPQTGDSYAIVNHASYGNAKLVRSTTPANTLDVSATGEAGIDWANIGGATTTVNLSGTTVKTATDVEVDTADIQSRLPAALVSGRMDASVGAMATDVITATALATSAVNEVADGVLVRNVSNVEGTAPEHCLATAVLATLEFTVVGTTLTIKRTDGTTTHATKTLTTDAGAIPIVGIN